MFYIYIEGIVYMINICIYIDVYKINNNEEI